VRRSAALAGALLFLVTACSAAPAGPAVTASADGLTATLTDTTIQLSQASIPSGAVTITVKNVGGVIHSLVVLKTNLAANKIPLDPADQTKADERGKVGGTPSQVQPGQSVDVRLDLAPGKYVLLCNEPAHYQIGMRVPLLVN
jgi:uncharacterized cupredoxin-like copper-binding protein